MENASGERKRRRVDDGQFVYVGEHLEGLKLQDDYLDQVPSSSSRKRGIREIFERSPDGNHKQSRSRLRNGVSSSSGTASIDGERRDEDFDSENEDDYAHNLRSMNQLLGTLHVQRMTRRQLRDWEENMSACLPPVPLAVTSNAHNCPYPSHLPAYQAPQQYIRFREGNGMDNEDRMMVVDDDHTMADFP